MATIKSYTDISQSKKLSEILPIESADMWYHGHYSPWKSERIYDEEPCLFHSKCPNWDNPCWSLSALLSVLPKIINNETLFIEISAALWHIGYRDVYTARTDNLVDACYELILKLNEKNLL